MKKLWNFSPCFDILSVNSQDLDPFLIKLTKTNH